MDSRFIGVTEDHSDNTWTVNTMLYNLKMLIIYARQRKPFPFQDPLPSPL